MTDVPEWDTPKLPSTAPLDARLTELRILHATADPGWVRAVLSCADDIVSRDEVAYLLAAVCRMSYDEMVGTCGVEVGVARLRSNLCELRAEVIEEMAE